MTEYSLAINDAVQVREELDAIGEVLPESLKASDQGVIATSQDTAAAYVERLPLVARMLTLELDPEKLVEPGHGRIAMNDAPPRLGDKLSKDLKKEGALEAVGKAMEMLLLAGFAAQAGLSTEPALAEGRSNDEVWDLWHGLIFPFHSKTDLESVLFIEDVTETSTDLEIRMIADRGLNEYVEVGERYGFVNFDTRNPRKMWRTGRAMTFAYFGVASGRALHRAVTEAGKVGG